VRVWAGTSGFAYKEWRGSFYPEDAKSDELLRHYGEKLNAVEINSTFYRMPRRSVLERWTTMVPEDFTFALKASRRITHQSRLTGTDDSVSYLWEQAQGLGRHLGPILFQLPPNFRVNEERLKSFVGSLPQGLRAAFEFRHESWYDESVFQTLRDHDAALCIADADQGETEVVRTASWGYARLRREAYSEAEVEAWLQRFDGHAWSEVFCFFKHEEGPTGPETAKVMLSRSGC